MRLWNRVDKYVVYEYFDFKIVLSFFLMGNRYELGKYFNIDDYIF